MRWRKNSVFCSRFAIESNFLNGIQLQVVKKLFVCPLALALTCSLYTEPYAFITNWSNYLHFSVFSDRFLKGSTEQIVVLRIWRFVTKNGGGLRCEAKTCGGLRNTRPPIIVEKGPKFFVRWKTDQERSGESRQQEGGMKALSPWLLLHAALVSLLLVAQTICFFEVRIVDFLKHTFLLFFVISTLYNVRYNLPTYIPIYLFILYESKKIIFIRTSWQERMKDNIKKPSSKILKAWHVFNGVTVVVQAEGVEGNEAVWGVEK